MIAGDPASPRAWRTDPILEQAPFRENELARNSGSLHHKNLVDDSAIIVAGVLRFVTAPSGDLNSHDADCRARKAAW
jgi:hypothetical protein